VKFRTTSGVKTAGLRNPVSLIADGKSMNPYPVVSAPAGAML